MSTPSSATVKEAVQKRITPSDHSSIIPGIDVNELKRSLDLLKYALDYSEAIVDTVKVPLIVLNKELRVLTANKSFYSTFKLSPLETENQLIYELNEGAWDIPRLKILLEKILPKNTYFDNYEVEINHPHIGHKTMLLSARKTYRQVNSTEAILLTFEDVTLRKQLDTQKDDFIGIVSHELRNPLTSIKAFSQLLEKHLTETKDNKGSVYLSKMTAQMERLTQLMASFMNVYNIQNGKMALNKEEISLDALVGKVVDNFKNTDKTHEIVFTKKCRATIKADPERLTQVLVNLLSNAIKYSPNGSKVIISASKRDHTVRLSVQDFGIGIPKDKQEKVFERFFRVQDKAQSAISGLGLGLYISSQLVKLHRGKLWVESEEGKGSTFFISLPLH